MNLKSELEKAIRHSLKNKHRFILTLFSPKEEDIDLLEKIIRSNYSNQEIIIATHDKKDSLIKHITEKFKDFNPEVFKFVEALEVLGLTKDILFFDARKTINANDIGRFFEIIRGGGLIVLLLPEEEEFKELITLYHQEVITPPYTLKDVKRIFNKWFLKNLYSHDGVIAYDSSLQKVKKHFKGRVGKFEKANPKEANPKVFDEKYSP